LKVAQCFTYETTFSGTHVLLISTGIRNHSKRIYVKYCM
jgi:hypothetical protein